MTYTKQNDGKLSKTEIYFVNDKKLYNSRYRSHLIKELSSNWLVRDFGFFDSISKFLALVIKLLFKRKNFIVSSNLKSNLLVLLFFWKPKLLIVNGLGRYRELKFLRMILLNLISLQTKESKILVQKNADYMFFRRYAFCSCKFVWMPGSGGTKRNLGADGNLVSIITRDEKLIAQSESISEFYSLCWAPKSIILIGVRRLEFSSLESVNLRNIGYVDQSKIMSFAKGFLVPYGYGEGIPHSLVDAIISGADIYLTKKNFISYGFYRYARYQKIFDTEKWVKLVITERLEKVLSIDNIVCLFNEEFEKLVCLRQ